MVHGFRQFSLINATAAPNLENHAAKYAASNTGQTAKKTCALTVKVKNDELLNNYGDRSLEGNTVCLC